MNAIHVAVTRQVKPGCEPALEEALLGVFPSALLWSSALPQVLTGLHSLAVLAIVNALVVVTLTWGVMPLLTRLFRGWLRKSR